MYAHRYISPVPAYSPIVIFGDGSTLFFRARERPHMILDEVQQRLLLSLFIMKMIILPRQARDKHRENSKKRCVFRRTATSQRWPQRLETPHKPPAVWARLAAAVATEALLGLTTPSR